MACPAATFDAVGRIVMEDGALRMRCPLPPKLWPFAALEREGHYELLRSGGDVAGFDCAVATSRATGKRVLIMRVRLGHTAVRRKQLVLRELKLMRHFRGHENLVSLRDVRESCGESPGSMFIVTDCFDTDLSRVIRSSQPLSDSHVKYLLWQILCGVKYLHSGCVVHGQLTPHAIMVNGNCDLRCVCVRACVRADLRWIGEGRSSCTRYSYTRVRRARTLAHLNAHTHCEHQSHPCQTHPKLFFFCMRIQDPKSRALAASL